MIEKIIRGSKRGLTFSGKPNEWFNVGTKYSYIIDRKNKKIHITPNEEGNLKVSRKKAGKEILPLIDLRNKDVLNLIKDAEFLKVSITKKDICIDIYEENSCRENEDCNKGKVLSFKKKLKNKQKKSRIVISKKNLRELRMAAGAEDYINSFIGDIGIVDEFTELNGILSRNSTRRIKKDLQEVYNVISLFSGAGIWDSCFANDNKFSINFAIDYDKNACMTYKKNIGNHIVNGDVHDVNGKDFKDVHLLIGGPSCKPFSGSNRKTRLKDHKDSDLVSEYVRIVSECNPEVFVMENVPTILTACDGEYYNLIKEELGCNGKYFIRDIIIKDNEVGGFTSRRRAFIIGSRLGPWDFPKLSLVSGFKTVREAFSKITPGAPNFNDVSLPREDTIKRMSFVPQGGNYKDIPEEYRTGAKSRHSNTYRRLALDSFSPCIVNWRKPPIIHPTENRILSVLEAKLLQGLPADFEICGTTLDSKQQQVGNSVSISMGNYIKNIIKKIFEKSHEEIEFA